MSTTGDVGAGHTLGRYELLVPIAVGGMASVWAARMSGVVQKIVAVKLMRAELGGDTDFEEMFLDEAALVSHIRHPNVAEILDVGEEDGVLYQVMEWVDGEPLNLVLRESRAHGEGVPLPVALRIVKEVCAGLHAAHELRGQDGALVGLVHRDVSPQNLIVGYDGIAKVVDFGVAKSASNLGRTSSGQLKGKVPYMAPEQVRGVPVDRRADIFALGIVFYQLVTGRHPFRADNEMATMRLICETTAVEPPRSLAPALPASVEEVILKALSRDRDARFDTMAELSRAIDRAFPAQHQVGADDIAAFMRALTGPRGDRRRDAIRDAMQVAAERDQGPDSRTPRTFARDSRPVIPRGPELEAIALAAAAAAQGGSPLHVAAGVWNAAAAPARRTQIATLAGIGVAFGVAVAAAVLLATSGPDDRPAPAALPLLSVKEHFLRAVRDAAAAATQPPPADPPPGPPFP